MTNLEVIGIIALMIIIIGGGTILYLALAGTAIIYSLGANESPKGRRVFFGILGVAMIIAFVCACVFFHKYGGATMKLREFIGVFEQSERLRIVKDGKEIYTGYKALMEHAELEAVMDAEVKRFCPVPEIRHKEWKKRGLMPPMKPEETPEFSFSDLQMTLYNTIYI